MGERVRQLAAPAYLFLCLILGGSAQGLWWNMILQLLGLCLIGWAALEPPAQALSRPARQLLWIVGIALCWIALQLVPLPYHLWETLGPRAQIAEAQALLGLAPAVLPLSVAPYDSIATLFTLIPPIALYLAIERLHAYRASYMVAALVAGTLSGIALGALQVGSPSPDAAPFYLYPDVNFGVATGFFASANHMAALLLVTLEGLGQFLTTEGLSRALLGIGLRGEFCRLGQALNLGFGQIALGGHPLLQLFMI